MTISVAQTQTAGNGYSGSFGGNVTAGHAVVLAVSAFSGGGAISTSSPVFGGSPVSGSAKLAEVQQPSGPRLYTAIWIMPGVPGGAASFGITVSGQTNLASVGLVAWDVSGLSAAPVLDKSGTGQALSGTGISSGASGSIASAPELVIGAYACNDGTASIPGAPWASSEISAGGNGVAGYQIPVSPGGSYTYSATEGAGAGPWSAAVVTITAGSAHTAAGSLTVTPSFSAARTGVHGRTGPLAVTPSFSAARARGRYRAGTVTVTPALTAAARRARRGAALPGPAIPGLAVPGAADPGLPAGPPQVSGPAVTFQAGTAYFRWETQEPYLS